MMKDEVLYGMLDEIRETIEANTEPDGNVRFEEDKTNPPSRA